MTAKRNTFIVLFLTPTLLFFCIFYLYPILTVFLTSFSKWNYTNIRKPQIYTLPHLFDNYVYIFTKYPFFWEALRNSFFWAMCGILIQMPLAALIAIMLSRKLYGWKAVRNIYVIPSMISSAAMGLIFLQLYNPRYGPVQQIIQLFYPSFTENILYLKGINFAAMTASYIFFAGPACIMILGQIFAIPQEIYEAALIDGAGAFRRSISITLPSIKGILKTVSIFAATSGFLLYNEVYFLTKGAAGTRSISYIIRELAITSPRAQYGRANTIGVIQILTGLLIILIINLVFSIEPSKKVRIQGSSNE